MSRQSISSLAAFFLLGVFAVCLLFSLLGGAGIYRRLTERDQIAHNSRTGIQYLATKVQQAPAAVQLTAFGDGDALVVEETIDGVRYLTRIYCYDGYLMELFSAAEGDFSPQDGEKLLEADSLQLTKEGRLLTVTLTQNQKATELQLFLRTEEEAAT